MPVRKLESLSSSENIKTRYKRARDLLLRIPSEDHIEFLKSVKTMFDLKKPKKLLQDSFFFGFTAAVLFKFLPIQDSLINCKRCCDMLKELLRMYKENNDVSENDSPIKLCKTLMSELGSFISIYLQSPEKSPPTLSLISILHHIPSLPKDSLFSFFTKFESSPHPTSIFSLFLNESSPYLPADPHKSFTLVLDIDETLVHFNQSKFLLRPNSQNLIKSLSSIFEIVSFTSAEESYGTAALRIVDPFGLIKFRLFRQHMVLDEGVLIKDLKVLGRDLKRVVIVDDRRTNFRLQPENGIKISPWTGDQNDDQLEKLMVLLLHLVKLFPNDLTEGLEKMMSDNDVYRNN